MIFFQSFMLFWIKISFFECFHHVLLPEDIIIYRNRLYVFQYCSVLSSVKEILSFSLCRVTCPQSYFVSELSWSPEEKLENTRDVTLEVCTMGVPEPDETGWNYFINNATFQKSLENLFLIRDMR